MFVAAARVLAEFSPATNGEPGAPLYPSLEGVREVSRRVALAVALEAQRAGLAEETTAEELSRRVAAKMWTPRYVPYVRRQKAGAEGRGRRQGQEADGRR
jgi:malate dehydrogenase (oxaloacetate-decarboxylating)